MDSTVISNKTKKKISLASAHHIRWARIVEVLKKAVMQVFPLPTAAAIHSSLYDSFLINCHLKE